MTLTIGTGPFGTEPAGRFNFQAPRGDVAYLELFPRWVRARKGGETVVDSRDARLLHRHGQLPKLLFPPEDVRLDLAEPAWEHEGLVHLDWKSMDEWLEEDEVQIGHVRDPYHRLDTRRTSRRVVVRVGGETLADSTRTKVLFETGLPPRWYFPEEDVRMELLKPTGKDTICAYKGHASYWSVGDVEDVVWTYREPLTDALDVRDLLCFFNEVVEIEVDGEVQGSIETQWSR